MEIVKAPEPWTAELTCKKCGIVVQITEEDLEVARFVDNAKGEYWFAGHPGHERAFVPCPMDGCKYYLFADACPEYIRNRIKEKKPLK